MARIGPAVAFVILNCIFGQSYSAQYLGKLIGKLSELHHGVSGEVYAVDGRTLHIKDYTYDGQGPAAYFYASTGRTPNSAGFRLRDENNSGDVIRRYRKEGVTLSLPEGKTLKDIKIFYVWCEEFAVNFGDVKIPRGFEFPRPQKIDPLKGVHGIDSDPIVIVDAQTLLIPNLSYDGEAPDAKFWVGRGPKPSPQGIRVPDENGKEIPLRRYDRKTIVLTLPGDLTVFDIGHFGIWCEAFTVDFGNVQIPANINIPPSLRMLGVSPQSKLNCEVIYDNLAFEVRWAVAGESIVLQLVAKLDNREYMSFGISGEEQKSVMVGGDVVVAWVDKETLKGYADDYYLDDKSQCSGPAGSCPDNRLLENTNNIRLLNAAMVNGYSIVTYQRPLKASDKFDKPIFTNNSQAIIWAVGPLNQRDEVSFHSSYTKGDQFLDFGRPARWNCPMPEGEQPMMKAIQQAQKQKIVEEVTQAAAVAEEEPKATQAPRTRGTERRRGGNRGSQKQQETVAADSEKSASKPSKQTSRGTNRAAQRVVPTPAPASRKNAWKIPPIECYEPEDGVYYAQMGPTGGKRGYPAITGHVGWGISWYINGLLIPEINVVRGKQYTFIVEGGQDPEIPAKYHPFYITDDSVGGYEHKTAEEKKNVTIFAGVEQRNDGTVVPTGTGRSCYWTPTGDSDAEDYESFGAYQRILELKCDQGEPGVIQWTPDKNTPDTVYYQCYSHRYLGWKINVLDSCDDPTAASEPKPVVVPAPLNLQEQYTDLENSESQRYDLRVNINSYNIKEDKQDNPSLSKFSELTNPYNPDHYGYVQDQPKKTQYPYQNQAQQQNFYNDPFPSKRYPFIENPYKNRYEFRPSPLVEVSPDNTRPHIYRFSTTSTTTSTTTTQAPPEPEKYVSKIKKYAFITAQSQVNPKIVAPPNSPSSKTVVRRPVNISIPKIIKNNSNKQFPPQGLVLVKQNQYETIQLPKSQKPQLMKYPIMLKSQQSPSKYPLKLMKNGQLAMMGHLPPQMTKVPIPMGKIPLVMRHPNGPVRQVMPQIITGKPMYRPVLAPNQNHASVTVNSQMSFSNPEQATKPALAPVTQKPTPPLQKITLPESYVHTPEVQISPEQPVTDAPQEVKDLKAASALLSSTEIKASDPQVNTGFKASSVIIEKGFKPIISKDMEKRFSLDEPELKYESEIGMINIKNEDTIPKPVRVLDPTFLEAEKFKRPFPKKHFYKVLYKRPRNFNITEPEDIMEPIAEAAERVESYYLPPNSQTNKPIEVVRQPSNIDIESPTDLDLESQPDVVVTYDGKKVSGASLTAKLTPSGSILDQRTSKASEYIRTRPQSVPFKGELPPLNPSILNQNIQLQQHGFINRDLDVPNVSTKLSRVANLEEEIKEDIFHERSKREAHHTPEHTLEQERSRNGSNSKSSGNRITFSSLSFVAVMYVLNNL